VVSIIMRLVRVMLAASCSYARPSTKFFAQGRQECGMMIHKNWQMCRFRGFCWRGSKGELGP
jgi:hypothetical protein